ncbi:MAG: protein kinase [bacterium]
MTATRSTVLVVDDLEPARNMLRRLLHREGFEVLTAADGSHAIEAIASHPIDLVLLDMAMPGMDGLEVLRHVRTDHSAAELPVIIQTAYTKREEMIEALEIGANDFVSKPIDFPVLLARIRAQLRVREAKSGTVGGAPAADGVAARRIELRPGTVIANRYEILLEIGAGNFASIYRARHLALDQEVAVKVLRAEIADRTDALARFRAEATLARQLNHPNAITVLDFGVTAQGLPYLVMELLHGRSLSDLLRQRARLSPRQCAEILLPVCHVLAEAHDQGIIHRDLKPSNIYLAHMGRREIVKVVDFGIAKLLTDLNTSASLTVEGSWVGTPAYMAPERLRNDPYDGRSDVYSLGVMLFEMLTGQLPFQSRDDDPVAVALQHLTAVPPRPRTLVPDVPSDLETVVMRCMAKEANLRPTAIELAELVARAVGVEYRSSTEHGGEAIVVDAPCPQPLDEPAWVRTTVHVSKPASHAKPKT